MRCVLEGCPRRRDTLTFKTKNYRLSRQTQDLLEAILRSRPHEFLTFEELFQELLRFYLHYHRTLNGEVERWLRKREEADDAERVADRLGGDHRGDGVGTGDGVYPRKGREVTEDSPR